MRSSPRNVAIDTGVFVALLHSKDSAHKACVAALANLPEITRFITTESCLVETSYLLATDAKFHRRIQKLIEGLEIDIVPLERSGLDRVWELMEKYSDLPMDFADASLVVACESKDIRHILTLDRRDFSVYRPRHCTRFQLLPEQ